MGRDIKRKIFSLVCGQILRQEVIFKNVSIFYIISCLAQSSSTEKLKHLPKYVKLSPTGIDVMLPQFRDILGRT